MRRTDRLFKLIQILRDGRLHTAQGMADRLEVSVRTIWRDMATLIASGLPVEGGRGVGYILREPITLPPLPGPRMKFRPCARPHARRLAAADVGLTPSDSRDMVNGFDDRRAQGPVEDRWKTHARRLQDQRILAKALN